MNILSALASTMVVLASCGGSAAAPASSTTAPPASSPTAASPAASGRPANSSVSANRTGESTSGAPSPAVSPTKITVSYSTVSPDDLPVWIAQDAGIFEANGLDVDLQFIASNTGVAALVANQIQGSAVGGSEVLAAAVGGASLEVLATPSPVFPYKLIAAPEIKTVQDLKGKTIGIARVGSSSDLGTRAALDKIGLAAGKDVKIIQVGSGPNRTAGLKSGAIQAAVTQPPDTAILERLGFHSLVDLTSLNIPNANTVIAVNRSWASTHKDVTQKLIDSVVQGIARLKHDKQLSVRVLEKYYKSTDTQAMTESYDYYAGQVIVSDPYPKPEQFQIALTNLAKEPQASSFNVSSMLEASYVKNAIKRGLDKS